MRLATSGPSSTRPEILGRSSPGTVIAAGNEDTAAACEVIDLAPAADGIIVHLRPLPGLIEDYRALVERALAN